MFGMSAGPRRVRHAQRFLIAMQVLLLVFSLAAPAGTIAVEPSAPPTEEPSQPPSSDPPAVTHGVCGVPAVLRIWASMVLWMLFVVVAPAPVYVAPPPRVIVVPGPTAVVPAPTYVQPVPVQAAAPPSPY